MPKENSLEELDLNSNTLDNRHMIWRCWNAFSALEAHKRYFMREFVKRRDLSENELKLLALVAWHNNLKQSTISKFLQIDAGNLSRSIDRMEEKQLLERRACPGDGRTYMIDLGPAGKEILNNFDKTLLSRIWTYFDESLDTDLYDMMVSLEKLDQKLRDERELYERYQRMKGKRS